MSEKPAARDPDVDVLEDWRAQDGRQFERPSEEPGTPIARN